MNTWLRKKKRTNVLWLFYEVNECRQPVLSLMHSSEPSFLISKEFRVFLVELLIIYPENRASDINLVDVFAKFDSLVQASAAKCELQSTNLICLKGSKCY